ITGVVVLLIGGKQVLSGNSDFTFGNFIAFILAVFSMLYPLKILTKAYANIRKALVSIERVSEILNRKESIIESKSQLRKSNFHDKIELQEVCFQYDEEKEILKDISFDISKGEKVAIVGSSGSGKTTLVNLLPRMYDVKSGKILIDGTSVKEINLKDLRNLFGIVTQESILFTDSIKNNIGYGTLKPVSQKEIEDAARIAFADEFIDNLPEQYDHFLHPKASNLSGGQKQRLCIARAIVGNPPILIFDEATSSLDTEAERKVQKAIEQATKNRTVIVIAHRLSTVLSSDKIIVLDQGKIVGIGHHEELLKSCERYKTLYEMQFMDK
ncbi:MAG TPA: ABC transporter ATP-binding protein, partial [Candidatus Cloacimonetes bacterium]|nr:ABC transporter ATP-binding protein [Candidatus Cloacimonadota bacterium]